MAISYVNESTVDLAGALNISLPIPAGTVAGDFMIAFVKQCENTDARVWDDDGGGGNGWTRQQYNRTTGGRDMETAIYWKIATASEATPTFTWAEGVTTEPISGTLLVYRGVDSFLPFTEMTYANAQNDGNPPNPTVSVTNNNSWVVCFHGATHDDISATAPPTGYTMRSQVWNGINDDHRNIFSSDSNGAVIPTGNYTPPDWQHSVLNTTPEFHTYSICLNETQPIGILTAPLSANFVDTGLVVTGFGFGASQLTGKLELWSDTSGTLKQTQSIVSWSDTSITFDPVQGPLDDDAALYLVVTNDNGDVSGPKLIAFGIPPYNISIQNMTNPPDIYHRFNNSYADEQGSFTANGQTSSGSFGFVPTPITRSNTHAWTVNDENSRIEMLDSEFTNITVAHTRRLIGGWIRLNQVHLTPSGIFEEGGGVNNLYIVVGFGNTVLGNVADSGGTPVFKVQAFSDIKLIPDRDYHVAIEFFGGNYFRLFLDGVIQSKTAGDIGTDSTMSVHSGDYCYGRPDGNLDTGGTDIQYPSASGALWSDWGTWSEYGNGIPSAEDIRVEIFEKGAIATNVIPTSTTAAMQISLDALSNTDYIDKTLALQVKSSSDGDFSLDLNNITFDDRCSIHVQYTGTGTLTLVNNGTSNCDLSKCSTPYGGTIVIQNPATFTISGIVNGAEVRVYDDDGPSGNFGTELDGTETNVGNTFNYSHSGTVNDIIVQMIADGYVELNIPFQLQPTDQTLTLNPEIDINA